MPPQARYAAMQSNPRIRLPLLPSAYWIGAATVPRERAWRWVAACRARSMAARSAAQPTLAPVASVVDDVEAPVFTLSQPANRSLDLRQFLLRATQQTDALVEQTERLGEVELRVVELSDDRFESCHLLLECHVSPGAREARTEVAMALTAPSRSNSSNAMFAEKSSIERSVRPSPSRGTAYPRCSVDRGLSASRLPANPASRDRDR